MRGVDFLTQTYWAHPPNHRHPSESWDPAISILDPWNWRDASLCWHDGIQVVKPGLALEGIPMDDDFSPAVYVVASRYRGTIYIGVTSALWDRVAALKDEAFRGFTSKYKIKCLVWYAHHHTMEDAISREKQLKAWKREGKFRLVGP